LEPKGLAERERPEVVTTLHDRIGEVLGWLDEPHTVPFRRHSGGFVLESVPAALYYFLRFRDDPEEAIIAAVNETRDADTVGAMAGTLVGAAHGVEALPSRLLEPLEYRERLTALGEALFRLATG
jgi:ADP-ribosylglycohydrolase